MIKVTHRTAPVDTSGPGIVTYRIELDQMALENLLSVLPVGSESHDIRELRWQIAERLRGKK